MRFKELLLYVIIYILMSNFVYTNIRFLYIYCVSYIIYIDCCDA